MNIVIAKTDTNSKVNLYNAELKRKLKDSINTKNQILGRVYQFTRSNTSFNIFVVKTNITLLGYLFCACLVLYVIFSNWFTLFLAIISGLMNLPMLDIFWQILYSLGLKKKGYKGKLKFISARKAWEVFLWDK